MSDPYDGDKYDYRAAWNLARGTHPANECDDPFDCPAHASEYVSHQSGWPHEWCPECGCAVPVVEEFDEQVGHEEKARDVRVTRLDCGHEVVRPRKGWAS